MRVDLIKWLFIGPQLQRLPFFEKAQEAGIIEFISHERGHELASDEQLKLIEALKILKNQPETVLSTPHESTLAIAERCIASATLLQRSGDRLMELQKELDHLLPLGEFSIDSLRKLEASGLVKVHFLYSEKDQKAPDADLSTSIFELGERESARYYLWIAASSKEIPDGFHVMPVMQDPSQIRQLIEHEKQLEAIAHADLQICKAYESTLKEYLVELIDQQKVTQALASTQEKLDQRLFICEGWVAISKKKELEALLAPFQVIGYPMAMSEGEMMPTYLENRELGQIGADLVSIYDVPAGDDKDPSLWVLVFFALFFGMIIGDGGYGLIFLLGTLYSYYRVKKAKGIVVRLRKLALILSLSCIAWGYLTNSFFGMSFVPTDAFRQSSMIHKLSLAKAQYHWTLKDETYREMVEKVPALQDLNSDNPQKILEEGIVVTGGVKNYVVASTFSDQILREFSLLMGAIHIILSLARYMRRNWSSLGWILFVIGGWLYFPSVVKATTFVNYLLWVPYDLCSSYGVELIYYGIFLGIAVSCFKNGLKGLLDIMTPISIFADAMSYLRLYALGLSGAIMGATFNDLAQGMGLVVGVLILLCGHIVNIGLNIMSGVIHGLRLNFLEWYHYSFSGGGKWHRPLKKINLNESSLP